MNLVRTLIIALIKGYQRLLSPLLGQRCRFYPSCSHYAHTCFETKNVFEAGVLTMRRLLKCHPWHPGGVDLP